MRPAELHARGGLADTLARIARLGEGYQLRLHPPAENWVPADELIHGGPTFGRVVERLTVHATDPATRRAIGSQLVLLYLRFLWPVVAASALERRVPDVAAANLLVRLDDAGWPSAFAIAEPRFAVLASDPVAEHASFVARGERD